MLGAGEELHGAHHGDVVPRPELVPRVAAQSCSRVAASPQVRSFREEAILGAASFILIGHHVEIILARFTLHCISIIHLVLLKNTSEFSSKTFLSKVSSADGMVGKE